MGDYECLKHCTMIDAIVDFTGGVAQKFRIKKDTLKTDESRDRMESKLKGALANNAYITCPIPVVEAITLLNISRILIKRTSVSGSPGLVFHGPRSTFPLNVREEPSVVAVGNFSLACHFHISKWYPALFRLSKHKKYLFCQKWQQKSRIVRRKSRLC